MSNAHPNFPDGLDIKVNVNLKSRELAAKDLPDIAQPVKEYGIAGRVWEAADVLIDYFSARNGVNPTCSIFDFMTSSKLDRNTRGIVELGSGTGYVGLRLSEMLVDLGRRNDLVILTDLPDVCPLLEKNLRSTYSRLRTETGTEKGVALNAITKFAPLSWGNYDEASSLAENFVGNIKREIHQLTHIVCSDLVYFPSLLAPLLRTLLHLTSSLFCAETNPPEVIIGYRLRSLPKETAFWTAFGLWFEYEPVFQLVESVGESPTWQLFGQSPQTVDTTFVFIARRRRGSADWVVPSDDEDLLGGVGAFGTHFRKGDDYFERLLLMQLDLSD